MIYNEVVHQVVVLASNCHISQFILVLEACQACCLWLAVSWSMLGASWYSKAWSLKLGAIDHDPGTKLSPSIAHDLELSCDGRKLARGCVTNFYCKFFHISFLMAKLLATARLPLPAKIFSRILHLTPDPSHRLGLIPM